MDELLGNYYRIIVNHFYGILQELNKTDSLNSTYTELLEQIQNSEIEKVDSEEIIYKQSDIKQTEEELSFEEKITCFIFELYLFYSEEVLDSIPELIKHQNLSDKSRNYLSFIGKVLQVKYAKDDEVIEKFKELLQIMPSDYEIIRILWDNYYCERDEEILLQLVNLAEQNYTFNDEILYFKAFLLKEMGKYDEALYIYSSIQTYYELTNSTKKDITWNYFHLADNFFSLKNMEKTIEFCNKTLDSIDYNWDEANDLQTISYNLKAKAYIQNRNKEKAIESLNKTLEVDESDVTAIKLLEEAKKL